MHLRLALVGSMALAVLAWASDAGSPRSVMGPPSAEELQRRAARLAHAEGMLETIDRLQLCRKPGGIGLRQFCGELRIELPLIRDSIRTLKIEMAAMNKANADGGVPGWSPEAEERNQLVRGLLDRTVRRLELLHDSIFAS